MIPMEYYDDAWDFFDEQGGRQRFDIPTFVDIYNDCDYCLVISGHNIEEKLFHITDLYKHKSEYYLGEMIDKKSGLPYTVIVTWHG